MNWFMLANELIQHSRNTSIATAVREIIKPPQLNKTMTSKHFKDYRSMFA